MLALLATVAAVHAVSLIAIGVGISRPGVVHAHDEGEVCTNRCQPATYRK